MSSGNDPHTRYERCINETYTPFHRLLSRGSNSVIYLLLFAFTYWRYGKRIYKMNHCLMVSWAFEAVYTLTLVFTAFFEVESHVTFWLGRELLNEVNFIIFLTIIFRLKAL